MLESGYPPIMSLPSLAEPLEAPSLDIAAHVQERLRARLRAQVIGRDEVIELVIVALLADGHVLLEDYPGSGKTTLAKALGDCDRSTTARTTSIATFRRIQFTPDLLPSDVTGVTVFDADAAASTSDPGRSSRTSCSPTRSTAPRPRCSRRMLEAMAEKQVTVDNVTHPLDELFFVIATQNPLDLAGTYPLPVAAARPLPVQDPHGAHRARGRARGAARRAASAGTWSAPICRRCARSELARGAARDRRGRARARGDPRVPGRRLARAARRRARARRATRRAPSCWLLPALQARRTLRGRDFVSSEDVETLLPVVLAHRIEAALGATEANEVVRECMTPALEVLARRTLAR